MRSTPLSLVRPSLSGLQRTALLFAGLLSIGNVFAQATPQPLNLQVAESDLTMSLLRNIFGDWSGAGITPVIGAAMSVFNSGVLVLGAVLFMYTAILGSLHSAHDGEVLGKKWSSVWVPARFAGGIAMIFPTASGFSIGQIFVMWVAVQGVGLGNLVWSSVADSFLETQGQMVSARLGDSGSAASAMRGILKAEVCAAKLRGTASVPGYDPSAGRIDNYTIRTGSLNNKEQILYTTGSISWGVPAHIGNLSGELGVGLDTIALSQNTCGEVILPTKNEGSRYLTGNISAAESGMIAAQAQAIIRASEMFRPLAEQIVNAENDAGIQRLDGEIRRRLNEAEDEYLAGIQRVGNSYIGAANEHLAKVIKDDQKNGWLTAGMWYYQMARINSEVSRTIQWTPQVGNITIAGGAAGGPGLSQQYAQYFNEIETKAGANKPGIALNKNGDNAFGATQYGLASVMNTGSMTDTAVAGGAKLFGFDPTNYKHPIIQMKDTGDYIMGIVELAGGLSTVADKIPGIGTVKAVTSAVSNLPVTQFLTSWVNIGNGISFVFILGVMILISLFVFGVTLSLYLPMVPVILWVGSMVGYFVTVFEMMVAVPIWMAAHLHPEGEGMAGRFGAQGYVMLIEVFARPVLMILGLCGALIVLPPVMTVLLGIFINSAGSMQADSVSGIITWLVLIAIYTMICVIVMHKLFALIHVIPNSVPRWFGASASGHDKGAETEHEAKGAIMAGIMAGRNAGSGAMGQARHKQLTESRDRAGKPPSNDAPSSADQTKYDNGVAAGGNAPAGGITPNEIEK